MSDTSTPASERTSLASIGADWWTRVKSGDVGSLPALLGLVFLVIVFSVLRPSTFTSELNFANLISQSAGIMVLAMGLVFVLLLGEIDLAAGYTGGFAAAMLGLVLTRHDWHWAPSILVGLLAGTLVGLVMGALVARLGIPSFVVTLAFFLGLQGVVLKIIGEGGTIGYRDDVVLKINNGAMPLWAGWLLGGIVVVGYALSTLLQIRRRKARGLAVQPTALWAIKVGGLAIAVLGAVFYLSRERSIRPELISLKGVPNVVVILVVLVAILGYLLTRTSWGRHVYAVGGNTEAARRAGINVTWVKISCFMMCSTMAAVGGLIIASRDNSVSGLTGGGSTLLFAVAAAVIGGTSLFGGKGKVTDAVVGGLVIAVINNGMGLLNQPASVVFMVTGGVLLLAAAVDAVTRRRAAASGRV